ncbi:MAG TPA: HAMP domain-containing sensor histidine kinase [Actinomycetota bacterium]|nr:HAMP domain-containing sensor histidine kinase [Actinomycetota bacterium]
MHRPVALPTRFRRRLTVAFVLVAGLSAGVLALGSFLLVREARLRDSLDRARDEAEFNLRQARELSTDADVQQFVDNVQRQRRIATKALVGDLEVASAPNLDPPIPSGLRELVGRGQLGYQRLDVHGEPYLVVGGRPAGSEVELYFLFPEQGLRSDLGELAVVLVLGWLLVVVAALLVGRVVAGRTLAPVAEAARASRALAGGLLSTRLEETRDEFGAWAASFNEMAAALEGKITELQAAEARERRFTSDVAHELRTPLTALVGEAAMLKEHLDRMPADARRPVELLVADVERLRRLVEDLLEISRLDAGRESVESRPVDLGALIEATVRSRGWSEHVRVEPAAVEVRSDPRRLERIVANLVANAVDHGGPIVTVRLALANGDAIVEVADDGPGIPPERLPHVFERFYKGDPSRSGSGSGLGLSIARDQARLLGGNVEVWSEPGAGTRFTLRVPVAEPLPAGDGPVARGGDDQARTLDRGGEP